MTKEAFFQTLRGSLAEAKERGLYKEEREIATPQRARILLSDGREVVNLCSNNYLGLAGDPRLIEAAKEGLDRFGFGLSSVRFICGTQTVHHELEGALAEFLGMEQAILYPSCFDANGGLFEPLFGPEDAIISDELNHASIIDGIRLCKAARYRYKNSDMGDLEEKLNQASEARFRVIATDGVFSMDGTLANLPEICRLADRYQALVMVDDCHAVGFMGKGGRGTHEHFGLMGRIDILTGTLGKALGGASGGYVAARGELVEWLRQRSRPYLFSNTLAPTIAAASLRVLELLEKGDGLRERLANNARYFRQEMERLGFQLIPGEHPIVPVMLGDAELAQEFSRRMLEYGIYVVGFFYPVVPQGKARIRTQMSAAHTKQDLDQALSAFERAGRELGVIP